MPLSLYNASVPIFIRYLRNLAGIMEAGQRFADENGLPHSTLLDARLIDDMAPLTAQIQRASDAAKFAAVRAGRVENVPMEDKEASFEELLARIAATIALLETVPGDAMDGHEDDEMTITTPRRTMHFTTRDYVLQFALPNFFFHVTTAYDLLRHKGVPIGKLDYLGHP